MIETETNMWDEVGVFMTELPIGSAIKVLANSFAIVVPLNGVTSIYQSKTVIAFEAKTIGRAYEDALTFIHHLQGVIDREREDTAV
jgi:hypothetical protein